MFIEVCLDSVYRGLCRQCLSLEIVLMEVSLDSVLEVSLDSVYGGLRRQCFWTLK